MDILKNISYFLILLFSINIGFSNPVIEHGKLPDNKGISKYMPDYEDDYMLYKSIARDFERLLKYDDFDSESLDYIDVQLKAIHNSLMQQKTSYEKDIKIKKNEIINFNFNRNIKGLEFALIKFKSLDVSIGNDKKAILLIEKLVNKINASSLIIKEKKVTLNDFHTFLKDLPIYDVDKGNVVILKNNITEKISYELMSIFLLILTFSFLVVFLFEYIYKVVSLNNILTNVELNINKPIKFLITSVLPAGLIFLF